MFEGVTGGGGVKYVSLCVFVSILTFLLFLVSLSVGSGYFAPGRTLLIIFDTLFLQSSFGESYEKIIIFELRLPRTVTAFIAGAALSISGAVYQALFRNSMADSYILGVSSGAAFGVAVFGLFGTLTPLLLFSTPLSAFVGASAVIFLVIFIADKNPASILLTGIAVSLFFYSLVSLVMFLNADDIQSLILWTMGSFTTADWKEIGYTSLFFVCALVVILNYAREINIISVGDESAMSVGVDIQRVRYSLLIAATLATSSVVAISGIIGFVGLIVPHMARLLVGANHMKTLPFIAIFGGCFMIGIDIVARFIIPQVEVPVGIITALIGSPLFIYILKKNWNR